MPLAWAVSMCWMASWFAGSEKSGAKIDVPLLLGLVAAIKAFSETGFYNWFTRKARKSGLPVACSPHGLRKACYRRLAEAECSPHEIMSASGRKTLKEVEQYTKAANRARLANSAMAALRTAQRAAEQIENRGLRLADRLGIISQSEAQAGDNADFFMKDGGGGWIRTNVGLANGFTVRPL